MLPRLATKFLGLLLIMSLSSCSFFTPQQLEDVRFMRSDVKLEASVQEIKENLAKIQSNAGGFYEVEVMPLTPPYLEARREEIAQLRGLDNQEQQKLKIKEEKLYLEGKNCFKISIQIVRHRDATSLQEWEASVIDYEGRFYKLDWVRIEPMIEGRYQTAHGKVAQWSMSSELCSRDPFAWDQTFNLALSPNFVPWPFPKTMNFQWVFEGPLEERKKKRKSYKRYRGY